MSTTRLMDLHDILKGKGGPERPALTAALRRRYHASSSPSLADVAAAELMNIPTSTWDNITPTESAAELLHCVEGLEAALTRENLSEADRVESVRLHREKLIGIYISLWRGEDDGEAYSREVEHLLSTTPGATERLEKHMELMQPNSSGEEEDPAELAVAEDAYARTLRKVLLESFPELTMAGRQELTEMTDFLQAAPQASCFLGTIHTWGEGEELQFILDLVPERRESQTRRSIRFIPEGNAAERERLAQRLEVGACLLRCAGSAPSFPAEGGVQLDYRVAAADICCLRCGWRALHRVFEKHPELRERVHAPS